MYYLHRLLILWTEFILIKSEQGRAQAYPMKMKDYLVPPIHAFPRKCSLTFWVKERSSGMCLFSTYIFVLSLHIQITVCTDCYDASNRPILFAWLKITVNSCLLRMSEYIHVTQLHAMPIYCNTNLYNDFMRPFCGL